MPPPPPDACNKQETRLRAIRCNNSERARRYRDRKKEAAELTLNRVAALQTEIVALSVLRQRLQLRAEHALAAPESRAARLVHEYYAVFRRGIDARQPTDIHSRSGARQEAFLRVMAHPTVAFSAFVGVTPLLDQWRRYSTFHASVRLELVSFALRSLDGRPVVTTTGVLHLRYSRTTLEKLFPHVLSDELLVQRLVGREVQLRYRDTLYFNERGQMTQYELAPDFVNALYDVVGNLRDVLRLLGKSPIEQDAVIKRPLHDSDDSGDGDGDGDGSTSGSGSPTSSLASDSPPPSIMDIQFILS